MRIFSKESAKAQTILCTDSVFVKQICGTNFLPTIGTLALASKKPQSTENLEQKMCKGAENSIASLKQIISEARELKSENAESRK